MGHRKLQLLSLPVVVNDVMFDVLMFCSTLVLIGLTCVIVADQQPSDDNMPSGTLSENVEVENVIDCNSLL